MREHILDRLAEIAEDILHLRNQRTKEVLAMAAMSLAITHHRVCPPAQGEP